MWLVGAVPYGDETEVTLPMMEGHGGQFGSTNNPTTVQRDEWGKMTVSFQSCTTATVQYEGLDGQQGTFNLQRITATDSYGCQD